MPVDASAVGGEVVVDNDVNVVTPVGSDGRAREATIDGHHLAFEPIRGKSVLSNVEHILQ